MPEKKITNTVEVKPTNDLAEISRKAGVPANLQGCHTMFVEGYPYVIDGHVPIVAFSTDTSSAGKGVYLLGFLPQSDVDRIISYAASPGRRSFAALLPD